MGAGGGVNACSHGYTVTADRPIVNNVTVEAVRSRSDSVDPDRRTSTRPVVRWATSGSGGGAGSLRYGSSLRSSPTQRAEGVRCLLDERRGCVAYSTSRGVSLLLDARRGVGVTVAA
ncbi:hypothetical protein FOV72_05725 [Gordonia rubripertincta]|nr:hypothetical protein FOV72_05725 [Gordonia rubripertincta]